MRNFDEERALRFTRERSFRIAGQEFSIIIGVHPDRFNEIMAPYNSITTRTSAKDALERADETIKMMLETDEDRERWDAIRTQARSDATETSDVTELAITSRDMRDVIEWWIEEQTGHPTSASSSSLSGRGRSGARLTGSSS